MAQDNEQENKPIGKLVIQTMEDVMRDSMIPYSESVILDRALPRVEDGLKPVQRRILYTMQQLGITPDKPYRKSARIVGDCLGKLHPHGDSSIYQAMVRMAQPFNMGATLVDGHGNFGSVDGDGAAAMRYTEARLTPLALELLRDIDKNTVKWSWNFDDTIMEPDILPGRFPNLLVNGATGIAVGLATNIPPHNLMEAIDGVIAYIDNSRITLKDMMKIIKGPDFPTGGVIIPTELAQAYETGKGKVAIRAKLHIENDNDKKIIVIDEIPYGVNKAQLLETIIKVREDKKGVLSNITDVVDESDRVGMRAVIKLKRDSNPKDIINALFKYTNLAINFSFNMVAIADGKPQLMGLLDIIAYYVNYQREVVLRRTRYELDAAKKREHILEGLVIAVRNIDEVIKIIKSSANTTAAKEALRKRFELSEIQAQAILDMRLARLTSLEIFKLEKELADVKSEITRLEAIIGSKKLQMELVKSELLTIRKQYKENRKSQIVPDLEHYVIPSDDEKPTFEYVIAANANHQIKRMLVKNFTMATKDFTDNSTLNEICNCLVRAKSTDRVFCFTNLGNCYKIDVEAIPDGKWREKGVELKKIVAEAVEGEYPLYMRVVEEKLPKGNLLFYSKGGLVKKSPWSEYGVVKSAFQATKLRDGDTLIGIEDEQDGCSLMIVTKGGMCLNADMSDIPSQNRIAIGVRCMMLADDDECILIRQVNGDGEVALCTDRGYTKRLLVSQIDVMGRYRKGIKIIDFGKGKADNGSYIAFAACVTVPYKVVFNVDDEYLTAYSTENFSIENRTHAGKPMLRGRHTVVAGYAYNDKLTYNGI
ncbi:MAG: DNA topoisomerase 4 subunit A [Clostridiales bacterium]|nr:DNA topoisomerase 4 subunit A [Clostridiales bacterium]